MPGGIPFNFAIDLRFRGALFVRYFFSWNANIKVDMRMSVDECRGQRRSGEVIEGPPPAGSLCRKRLFFFSIQGSRILKASRLFFPKHLQLRAVSENCDNECSVILKRYVTRHDTDTRTKRRRENSPKNTRQSGRYSAPRESRTYRTVTKVLREVKPDKTAQLPESAGDGRSLDTPRRAKWVLYSGLDSCATWVFVQRRIRKM